MANARPYKFDIALFLKLALDEVAHLWVFFPSVERWTCRKP
jgi:hypothetical protein